jgi:ZIP family zinc transporter
MNNVVFALGITLFAGLATGIGSILAFFVKRTNFRFLSVATGFSAGVMIYVSFVEIFPKGIASLTEIYGDYWGHWVNAAAFFGGILFIGLIDNLIPAAKNPHETHSAAETAILSSPSTTTRIDLAKNDSLETHVDQGQTTETNEHKTLMRMGLFTALAIAIHNFPEGLATFLVALENPTLGVAIAVAIALHNIPEGISVSVPIFYATGDRKKAFLYSLLSGLAEPIGAGFAYLMLLLFTGGNDALIPPQIMGILFGGVAGIMVYISVDELLPTSRAYGKSHDSILGLVGGMVVMAISLLIMR